MTKKYTPKIDNEKDTVFDEVANLDKSTDYFVPKPPSDQYVKLSKNCEIAGEKSKWYLKREVRRFGGNSPLLKLLRRKI